MTDDAPRPDVDNIVKYCIRISEKLARRGGLLDKQNYANLNYAMLEYEELMKCYGELRTLDAVAITKPKRGK